MRWRLKSEGQVDVENSPWTGYSTAFGAYDGHQESTRNDNQRLIRYLLLEECPIAVW
jgi:hypothetical protein